MPQIREVRTACQGVTVSKQCFWSLKIYFFFPRGHRTSTCPLGWKLNTLILVSFTFEKSSILQCRRLLPVAITNKNIYWTYICPFRNWRIPFSSTWLSEVVLQLLHTLSLALLYSQATQLHCQVHISHFFYPVEFNRAKKPTLEGSAWTWLLNLSSLSLFSFSELNNALNTNEYN